ncbi:MAG: hypothetical protein H5T69_08155 [Chloroflexi bacterium]|nr:hypothetical protein [Chloroflexota bacterium]
MNVRSGFYRALMVLVLVLILAGAIGCRRVADAVKKSAEVAEQVLQRATDTATPTLAPTATPSPTPSPTPLPTATPTSQPAAQKAPTLPAAVPQEFTIELTEEQLNGYVNGGSFEMQGVRISDAAVQITPQEVIVTLHAVQPDAGLNLGAELHGKPKVIDGTVYLEVTQVNLDESVKGLTRIIAQGLISAALDQYAKPNGIPIHIENATVDEVQLAQDKLIVKGRSKS